MDQRVGKVATLLFGSGFCALIYQVVWLREMRLIFGASTAASAAVLAIFMGGLGIGGAVLGRRADARHRPLAFYAQLELAIAVSAALTPVLVGLARTAYLALGGSVVLGSGVATVVRLMLATVVLCVPTFLMGGTLPAAARAAETAADVGRRNLALLYGSNTLGAVTGAFLSTFFFLEIFGTRNTLWLACLLNALVAMTARNLSRTFVAPEPEPARVASAAEATWRPPTGFVLFAAAVVGFSFLLMELVWYRMLGPLLGGSSFTFGLILAVALLGIGLGGASYALFGRERSATLGGFALTCVMEALWIAIPYALGDRVAFLAILLRPLGSLGFGGLVLGWAAVTALVVFPAAFVAGVQFPLLIALLGRGEEKVGRHVGSAYAWNTFGGITGSLAGGFGLLPALSATGSWCLVVWVLVALGASALLMSVRGRPSWWRLLPVTVAAGGAVLMLQATGPTAAWRHSPIGAGRADQPGATRNSLHDWANSRRRSIRWAVDGVESSVALEAGNGYAFVVNGKTDGSARGDAATQVMGGLLGGLLHARPMRALVVGLGTGSTAGWLGAIPSMERVDVVELEPAIVEIARACAPVSLDVLANPKVHIVIGDAREVLLAAPGRYDIIFSEPSNPYRAGIASLFTQEFYQAVSARLAPGGIFLQWLQAYEVDSQTVRTAYATLVSVFPAVETWRAKDTDLILVATLLPLSYNADWLRARIQEPPFKAALAEAWRVTSLEGVLAHFVAHRSLAQAVAEREGDFTNTDDRTLVEFAFARSVGRRNLFDINELRDTARARNEDQPDVTGAVDWSAVDDERIAMLTVGDIVPAVPPHFAAEQRQRAVAQGLYVQGRLSDALAAWRGQTRPPRGPLELAMVAELLADAGDDSALIFIEQLRVLQPTEADVLLGRLRWRQGQFTDATDALVHGFSRYREDPWPWPRIMSGGLAAVLAVAERDRVAAGRLFETLRAPFSMFLLEQERLNALLKLLPQVGFEQFCAPTLAPLEPHVPWQQDFLLARLRCYQKVQHPLLGRAKSDVDEFLREEAMMFGRDLTKGDVE
jgi:spermidine synthase